MVEAAVGADDMAAFVDAPMGAYKDVEFRHTYLFGVGDTVFAERLDCFDFNGDGTTLNRANR
jgi:hypothetical protein